MSRIGKKPIAMPKGVEFKLEGSLLKVKGPKGELQRQIDPRISIESKENEVWVGIKNKTGDKSDSIFWGLYRALINNMIKGVSVGFEKALTFQGVGYRAAVKGNDLELNLGYSHPKEVKAPAGIQFKVEKNKITVSGIEKDLVGQVAAEIKKQRPPEPYHGSGIKYENEIIIKKAGKKAATAAT